jgi:hypothetical protein
MKIQLHALTSALNAALPPEKEPPEPIAYKGWVGPKAYLVAVAKRN